MLTLVNNTSRVEAGGIRAMTMVRRRILLDKLPADWLTQIKLTYPRRSGGHGWGYVKRRVPQLIESGECWFDIISGIERYREWCDATNKTGTELVKQCRTFLGPDEWWHEDYELPNDGSVPLTLDQQARNHDLERQPGESDASLEKRLGIAMTLKQYSRGKG